MPKLVRLHQSYHTELGEELRDGTHQHANCHNVEHRLEQQVVGCLHEGVEHVGQRHAVCQEAEEGKEDDQEDESLEASAGGELQSARLAAFLVGVCLMVTEHLEWVNHTQ